MSSMSQVDASTTDLERQRAALDLWAAHRAEVERIKNAEFQLIVASWNNGWSMDQIAAETRTADGIPKSKTPVRTALHRAEAMGLLRRPIRVGRQPSRTAEAPAPAAGE